MFPYFVCSNTTEKKIEDLRLFQIPASFNFIWSLYPDNKDFKNYKTMFQMIYFIYIV